MRLRHVLTSMVACAALGLLAACGTQTVVGSEPAGAAAGGSAAAAAEDVTDLDFTATTVAGDAFEGASLAGSPTVLWFWAPWCSACRAQVPGVGALAERHGNAIDVVGVGSLDAEDEIAAFAADVSPDVTVLTDPDGAVWRHFGVTAQSTYLVVDADGRAVASGALSDAELAATVDDLIG